MDRNQKQKTVKILYVVVYIDILTIIWMNFVSIWKGVWLLLLMKTKKSIYVAILTLTY